MSRLNQKTTQQDQYTTKNFETKFFVKTFKYNLNKDNTYGYFRMHTKTKINKKIP